MSKLVCLCGYAGVGKTTVGKKLAESLGYVYIDKDTVTGNFMDYIFQKTGITGRGFASAIYHFHLRKMEYDVIKEVVKENLEIGNGVVLSAPLIREVGYEDWIDDFHFKEERSIKLIHVTINNPDIEKERIIDRGLERDMNKLEKWETYIEKRIRLDCVWNIGKDNFIEFDNTEELTKDKIELLSDWVKI